MKKYLLILSVLVVGLASCSKEKTQPVPVVDVAAQAKIDNDLILAYLNGHPNILATKDETSGVYYQVLDAGTGEAITPSSKLIVNYEGKDLKDVVFEAKDNLSFTLPQVIAGWQIGLPKIKNGGKILLIIPSNYGYGPYVNGPIPANSVLIFTITVKSVDGKTPAVG
ncbi:FKBP-type peptidyl-prolyl cis-trans isomerase [Mucilaginibacter lutimaris]|uniref:Peptidyl-prolyl cis-trans isomerase n=1 Tax=Mucilaginibacter lutimaris TaxID=931629 RepID=A0ABW2ZJW1_9SPHI